MISQFLQIKDSNVVGFPSLDLHHFVSFLKLHLVTYNTKYFDFHAAADKPDGLSVVAVFLLVRKND